MNYFSQLKQTKQTLCCLLVLILVTAIVYFNSLKGSFQYDDIIFQQRIWVANLEEYDKRVALFSFSDLSPVQLFMSILVRPFVLFTFALNNDLDKSNPFGFHLANLIFHILTTILVFFVIKLAFQISRQELSGGIPFALISALVFAIHPALTESVVYISSRSSELLTFFYLLGIWYSLILFQGDKTKKISAPAHIILIILCFYLSLTSKIVAVTFPVSLALLYIFLVCPKKYPNLYRNLTSPPFLAGYAILLVSILMFVTKIPTLDKGKSLYGHLGYLFIQIKIIVFYYLKIFLWPINLNVDINYPFSSLQTDPNIILAILIGLGLITITGLKGGVWAKICVGWFILTLAPTSSILPVNDLAVEHRLYLPATLGICPLFALAIQKIPKNLRYKFLFFLLASFAVLTAERNKVWTNESNLWQDVLKKSPKSARPYNNLGKVYYEAGDVDQALKYFKRSVEIFDKIETAHYNMGNIYMDKKQLDLSEQEYKRAIEINPLFFQAHMGLGSIQNQMGKLKEAEKTYKTALKMRWSTAADEEYPIARLNLAEVYGKMGRFEDSIKQSKLAIQSIPNSFKAYYNIGTANMKLGRLEEAKESFLTCLKFKPEYKNALYNLALVYQKLKQFENSNQYFSKFLDVQKAFPKAHVSMGINYAQMNKLDQAIDSFQKALALNPKILNTRAQLARILAQKGKNKESIEQLKIILAQNPSLNNIRIQLGLMYWKNEGKLDQAKSLFEAALKSSANQKERTQLSYWLKELSKK